MSRLVYLRHAEKEYNNGDAELWKHDPGITSSGVEKTKMVTKHLLESWGPPDKIISSPYRRTRETAIIMNSVLEEPVEIKIDTGLSEYLGNHRGVPMDVTPETKVWQPPHPESFTDMKKRVKAHFRKVSNYTKNNKGEIKTIWFVTHGLILKQISEIIGLRLNRQRLPNLTCLSVVKEDHLTKGEILLFRDDKDLSGSYDTNHEEDDDSGNIKSGRYGDIRDYDYTKKLKNSNIKIPSIDINREF